ncbi:MAG: pentapeptide repeat-containing protein [Alphaproteobacteria bacterium GM202ARS2]|nr:pentapeptide repeat-containing protein [Alphaproteobacteria bacterium GM202ARS2]
MTAKQKKPIWFWWVAGVLIIVGIFVCWLGSLDKEMLEKFESISKILFNLGSFLGIFVAAYGARALYVRAIASQSQAETARKTQVSEQLTQAMKMLAQMGRKDKEARIGGLYSLESLANNEPMVYGVPVMKAIVAYIRENAQKTAGEMPEKNGNSDEGTQLAKPLGEDVKVAFAVLKRLYDSHARTPKQREKIKLMRFFDDSDYEGRSKHWGVRYPVRDDLDFSRVDFRELDFRGVDWVDRPCCDRTKFQNTNLWNANFVGAHLEGAILQGAYAYNIDMRGANLWRARLQGVNLLGARLQGSSLREADLHGAILSSAKLQGANLQEAKLQGADLDAAKLQGISLFMASLWLSIWYDAKIDDNRSNLKRTLKKAQLPKTKITEVLDRFDKQKKNKSLWNPDPDSKHILCCNDFSKSLDNLNADVERLSEDDDEILWYEEWDEISRKIPEGCRHHTVDGLTLLYISRDSLHGSLCFDGLFKVIKNLDDYSKIKERLSEESLHFLENQVSSA